MITLESLKKQVIRKRKFDELLNKLEELKIDLWGSPLLELTYGIFDEYIDSHFTDKGQDLFYWWMYEDVPKIIFQDTLFAEEEINVEDIEDLWKYMMSEKELYFK